MSRVALPVRLPPLGIVGSKRLLRDASPIQRLDDPDPLNIRRLEPPRGVRAEDAKVDQLPEPLQVDSRALGKLSHG
jgi:hypothetical protein